VTEDAARDKRRAVWSILIGIALVVVIHVVALTVLFTAASGWDTAYVAESDRNEEIYPIQQSGVACRVFRSPQSSSAWRYCRDRGVRRGRPRTRWTMAT
jgi:hypothetical protein